MSLAPAEIARLRLAAQRIAGEPLPGPADAVRWLTAVQAQDLPGALASVALRSTDRSREAVLAAMDAGAIVRSWPMRGTLHLVAAEDLGWMLAVAGPRVVASNRARRAGLGIDEATIGRATEVFRAALGEHGPLARDELLDRWRAAGLEPDGGRGYHLLHHLALTGELCFGPTRAGAQLVVALDDWVAAPRRLDRDAALGEWAARYFAGHGPATLEDFARWTGLTKGDARAGLAIARERLESVDAGGVEHLMDPATPERLAAHRETAGGVVLLPGFDEYILGYADRTAAVPAAHADRIVPGRNGMFRPTVVADGQVVGTWRAVGRGAKRRLETEPFTRFPRGVAAAAGEAFGRMP